MNNVITLKELQQIIEVEYAFYKEGKLSEREYCQKVKPIDEAISKIEMAMLQSALVWKKEYLQRVCSSPYISDALFVSSQSSKEVQPWFCLNVFDDVHLFAGFRFGYTSFPPLFFA